MRATIPKNRDPDLNNWFFKFFLLVLQECDNRWLYLPAIKYDFKVLGCKNLIKSTGCVFTSHTNHLVYDFLFSLMQLNFTPVAKKYPSFRNCPLKLAKKVWMKLLCINALAVWHFFSCSFLFSVFTIVIW